MSKQFWGGIDLGATAIKYGLLTDSHEVIKLGEQATATSAQPGQIIAELTQIVDEITEASADQQATLGGVGLACPGLIEQPAGISLVDVPYLENWRQLAVGDLLRESTGLPIAVENDANAMLIAECRLGAACNADTVLAVNIGSGIGGALAQQGQLWRGSSGGAGEIGHVIVKPGGKRCRCGRNGCLIGYVGVVSWLRQVNLPQIRTGAELFCAYNSTDPDLDSQTQVRRVIDHSLQLLAEALDGAISLVDPDLLLLGGGVFEAMPTAATQLSQALQAGHWPSSSTRLTINQAQLGNAAGFVGAALIAKENYS